VIVFVPSLDEPQQIPHKIKIMRLLNVKGMCKCIWVLLESSANLVMCLRGRDYHCHGPKLFEVVECLDEIFPAFDSGARRVIFSTVDMRIALKRGTEAGDAVICLLAETGDILFVAYNPDAYVMGPPLLG
jgi:hypothetical protein